MVTKTNHTRYIVINVPNKLKTFSFKQSSIPKVPYSLVNFLDIHPWVVTINIPCLLFHTIYISFWCNKMPWILFYIPSVPSLNFLFAFYLILWTYCICKMKSTLLILLTPWSIQLLPIRYVHLWLTSTTTLSITYISTLQGFCTLYSIYIPI